MFITRPAGWFRSGIRPAPQSICLRCRHPARRPGIFQRRRSGVSIRRRRPPHLARVDGAGEQLTSAVSVHLRQQREPDRARRFDGRPLLSIRRTQSPHSGNSPPRPPKASRTTARAIHSLGRRLRLCLRRRRPTDRGRGRGQPRQERQFDRARGPKSITSYTYDIENRLVGIQFPDGTAASYEYDALGRRIEKNVNGTVTRYLYDGTDILLEFDANNQLRARYTQGPGTDEDIDDGTRRSNLFLR